MKSILFPLVLCALLSGCLARTGNHAELQTSAIADEAMASSGKLTGLKDAKAVTAELNQCAGRMQSHIRKLAQLVQQQGQAHVRDMIGDAYRKRLNGSFKFLRNAITAAERRLGKKAIAGGVGRIKNAINTLSGTL